MQTRMVFVSKTAKSFRIPLITVVQIAQLAIAKIAQIQPMYVTSAPSHTVYSTTPVYVHMN
jgi:hypothetical protein